MTAQAINNAGPTIADLAHLYVSKLGFHLVPLPPRAKKPISNDWGKDLLSDPDAARDYFSIHQNANMGVALGPSRVCSFDVDDLDATRLIFEEFGWNLDELVQQHPTIQGQPPGMRVMFRVPEGMALPYHQLQWPRQDDPKKRFTVWEIRSADADQQRQDVLPPSIHPDTGKPYTWVTKPKQGTGLLPPPDFLLQIWANWDALKPQFQALCPWAEKPKLPQAPKRPSGVGQQGESVIDAYNNAHGIVEALTRYGYKRQGKRYLSPHSQTKLAGVNVFSDDNKAFIHHASDPLCSTDKNQPAAPFDLFCYYEHGGDMKAAVKAAAQELGIAFERRQPMPVRVPPPEAPPPYNVDPETGEITDYVPANDNVPTAEAEPLGQLTSWLLTNTGLKVVGRDEDDGVWLIPPGSRSPVHYRTAQLTRKAELIGIMPLKDWEGLIICANEGDRFKAELAASAIMSAARENPLYRRPDPTPRKQAMDDELTGVQGRDSAIIARKLQDLTLFDVPTQAWWRWDTVWRRIDDEMIRKVLVREADAALGEEYENSYINGTLALLRSRLARLPDVAATAGSEIWENDRNLLPMRNGVLDLESGRLLEHSPDFMFNWMVPHNYDPDADCPVTEKFITNLAGGDPSTEWVLWAFLAAVLHGRSDLQRYLEFVGMAGTGKSTFITLCKELVGDENVHSTDMRTLHNSQFETANIYGKRLTVISDADKYGGDVGVFKSLTGEDIVRREEKNKQAQKSFVYRGMVIVAANNPVQFSDTSTAMARRRIPVHIDKKLDKSAVDFRLQHKLRAELPGLINRLLDIDHDKVTEVLTDTEGHRRNAANRALVETNAIAAWANECLVVDIGNSCKVGKLGADADTLLYPNYARFCEQTGRRGVVALNTFTRSLTDVLATVGVEVLVKHKNTGTHIEGIRLRTAPWDDETPRLMINM